MHGELLKLGIDVCQATVAKYMGCRRQPPSQTWRTFLSNHVGQIVAADFFVVPTVTFRLVFVLVLLAHDRRRIRHVAVTAHPTAAWTAQQLREAFPWDEAPRYLIHDSDHAFDSLGATAKAVDRNNDGARRSDHRTNVIGDQVDFLAGTGCYMCHVRCGGALRTCTLTPEQRRGRGSRRSSR